MANNKIRRAAGAAGIHHWQVAEKLGINEASFSRKLRRELPQEEQENILRAIAELEAGRDE